MTVLAPQSVDEIQAAVRAHRGADEGALRPMGSGTKSALAPTGAEVALDLRGLDRLVEYQPQECTFTALAGTRVEAIAARLAEHGHYLPFDPPFGSRGATIGGTVASALSGPARYRYGGVRDFLLGVRFIDGEGRSVRGGGRVVKNAAGFYLHHLLLGSLGRLGVITEVTCKVFPSPAAQATVRAACRGFESLIARLALLRRSPFEIESIEIEPPGALLVRLGGVASALGARIEGLTAFLREDATSVDLLDAAEEARVWRAARELTWAERSPAGTLVRIATTPGALVRLEPQLESAGVVRRYGMGGEITWVVWERPLADLDRVLSGLGLSGVAIEGPATSDPYLGVRPDPAFLARVKRTLDPRGVFGGQVPGTGTGDRSGYLSPLGRQ
jgi:glycolate oxidase FAD binding subunit